MGDLISRLRLEGPRAWRQLSAFQRATLVAVGLGAVVAILFLGQWAQQPEYSAAYTRLSEADASAVVAKLKELKIPYQLSDGGSTVRVPSESLYDVRLQLASLGLPKGGTVGFELFDKMSFGLTDFAQKLNFQRALEGELSRTIGRISGVEEARVHIVLPQTELFAERDKAATASVVLKLRPGFELDSRQVRGVANLVSRSVEGLKPENITVLDGDGIMLSGQSDDLLATAGRSGTQREAQRGYEYALQRDIQGMLEQVLGPRKAVVRVSAALDWDQHESSTETYSPEGKEAQVRSSREVVERSATSLGEGWDAPLGVPSYPLDPRSPSGRTGGTASGTATPVARATPGTQTVPGAGEPRYDRREVTNNYELSKQVERTIKAPGAIKRLSVSVMLDGQLDEGLTSTVSRAVTAAAGLDAARGDSVVVASLPFDQSASVAREQASQETASRELYMTIARGALAVISILVVALLVRSMVRGLTRDYSIVSPRGGPLREVDEAIRATPRPSLTEEERRPRLVQREVTELAKAQPKLVAGILKTWLDDR